MEIHLAQDVGLSLYKTPGLKLEYMQDSEKCKVVNLSGNAKNQISL